MISKRTRRKGGGFLVRAAESKVKRLAEKYSNKSALNVLKKKYPKASRLAKRVAGEVGKHSPETMTKISSNIATNLGKITKNAKSEIEKYLRITQIDEFKKLTNNIEIAKFIKILHINSDTIFQLKDKLKSLIGPGPKTNFEQIRDKVLEIIKELSDEELNLLKTIFFYLVKLEEILPSLDKIEKLFPKGRKLNDENVSKKKKKI